MHTPPQADGYRPFPSRHLRKLGFCTAFATALFAGRIATAQEEVWTGPSSSLWSAGSNWLDGTAPASGGDPALTLRFSVSGGSVNDLAGPFALNQLIFSSNSASSTTVSANSGSSLNFTGIDPTISLQSISGATISAPIVVDSSSGGLAIKGAGPGFLSITGGITQGAQPQSLTIDTGITSPNAGFVSLSGTVGLTGGVVLKSGNFSINSNSALGTGALNAHAGTITLGGTGLNLSNAIVLHGDVTFRASGVANTLSGVISGAVPGAGLTVRSLNSFIVTGTSTYTGATTLDYNTEPGLAINSGRGLAIRGAGGSILQTSEFNVRAGSSLEIEALSGTDDRVGNTTPIHLRGGNLYYVQSSGGSGSTRMETTGAVDGAGYSSINALSGTTRSVRLHLTSLARTERGTFLFRGDNLGNTPAVGVGSIFIDTAPTGLVGGGGTGPKTSILPYAVGDLSSTGDGFTFVTYSATSGVRMLNTTTDFKTTIASAAADENVRLISGPETLNASRTVNALQLSGSSSVRGSGTLTIASGALLNRSGISISASLAFGAAEANIFTVGDLVIGGVISGTNGLTKSGYGKLTLGAANTFTGPLTVNAGTIEFGAANGLGLDTSAIKINGHGAGLSYSGLSALNFGRAIETGTGLAKIDVSASGTLAITSPIVGDGGLQLTSASGGAIILPTGSTYAGITHVGAGRVAISNDSAFGAGGALHLDGGTIVLSGDWNAAREIAIRSGTLDTAGFNATWSGTITGINGLTPFTKRGAGELRILKPSRFQTSTVVEGGALTVTDDGEIIADVSVMGGAELKLDHSASTGGSKLADTSSVYLDGGKLAMIGNAASLITEKIHRLAPVLTGRSDAALDLITPGAAGLRLLIGQEFSSGGGLLIRASNLGDKERVTLGNTAGFESGIIRGVYAGSNLAVGGDSFVVYDTTSDAGGVIGFRALKASEYTTGSLIQNPVNGGTTPENANLFADSAVTASGASNLIDNLTLANGGSVTLGAGQSLRIGSGQILSRVGTSAISDGTLDFGAGRADIYASGDLTIGSGIQASGGLRKMGPGTLLLSSAIGYTGGTEIADGTLRVGSGVSLASEAIGVYGSGVFDVGAASISLGAMTGTGNVHFDGGMLSVGGLGTNFTYSGGFTGLGQVVIVSGGNPAALRTFNGATAFGGDVILNSGRLQLGSNTALGSAVLIVNGGSLRTAPNVTVSQDFLLNADLPLLGSNPIVFGPGASATGPKDFVLRSAAAVNITGNLSMTGGIRTQYGPGDEFVVTPGTITVRGPAGSLNAGTGVKLEFGGRLDLDDSTAYAGGGEGRLADTLPVHLGGGKLGYIGNGTINSGETLGTLSGAGLSTVSFTPSAATTTTLTASSLTRVERGTFVFETTSGNLGGATGPGVSQILFQTAPALVGGGGVGTATSIVPWAIAVSGGVRNLVTYGSNGIRPLTSSEYLNGFGSAGSTNNVRLAASATVSSPQTINALSLGAVNITGSGPLSIVSGTVLADQFSGASNIVVPLSFDSVEAKFFIPDSLARVNVSGSIRGSGGLTVSGQGTLALSAANQFTGAITINDGVLEFSNPAGLGPGAELITLHGNSAHLRHSGTDSVTLSRNIRLGGGIGSVSSTAGSLILSGELSGPGGLRVSGLGGVTLPDVSNYEGPTLIDGSVAIGSDASLGAGDLVFFTNDNSYLRLNGNWTTSRHVTAFGGTIDTNGYEALIAKPLETTFGNISLTKTGLGALRLPAPNSFVRRVTVLGGEVRIEQAGTFPAESVALYSGGSLVLDNTSVALGGRIPQSTFFTMLGGELRVLGHSATSISESLGTVRLEPGTASAITLTNPGNGSNTLSINNFSYQGGMILFRGDNLGGTPGSPFTRVNFTSPPTLAGGIIPGAIADTSSTGQGSGFATYDTSIDAAGTVGVRPLKPSEYVIGSEIRNPANGGETPQNAHFFANGPATVSGVYNRVSTLRLGGAASVTLSSDQTLALDAAHLMTDSGANASISGGTLQLASQRAYIITVGDLSLNTRLISPILYKTGPGTLTLGEGAKVHGRLDVSAGSVNVASADALSSTRLTMKAGTAVTFSQLPAASGGIVGPVVVDLPNGMLAIETFFDGVKFTGSGGVTATGSGTFSVPQTFTGPLVITAKRSSTGVGGTILSGDGTALLASSVSITPSATLYLRNEDKVLTRLGVVPLDMNGGQIVMSGGAATETFASLTARGVVGFSVEGKLVFNSFQRMDRATLRAGSGVVLPASVTSELVGANTSATTRPILPYAYANLNGDHVPVTFSPGTGLRALISSELSTTLAPGTNIYITAPGSVTNDANIAINSLSTVRDILGTGTLEIASGLLLNNGGSTFTNAINFGAAEAHILSNPSTFTMSGPLTGTGGLTKTGIGALILPITNNVSGPLTINEGTISFSNPAQLGLDNGEIFMHSGGVTWSGTGDFNFPRSVRLTGGPGVLGTTNPNGILHITQPVVGPGDLKIVGRVVLETTLAHTGDTVLNGTLSLASDSLLGMSPQLTFGDGTLALTQSLATNRAIYLFRSGTADTAGFDLRLQGPMTGGGQLTKIGSGRLVITDAEDYEGLLCVSAGVAEVDSYLSGRITSLAGTAVVLGGSLAGELNVQGTLDLGPGVQAVSTSQLLLKPNSNLKLRLDSGLAFDQIISMAAPSLDGPITLELELLPGWDPADGIDQFVVVENASSSPIVKTTPSPFVYAGNALVEGEQFTAGGQIWKISYEGGSGNDIVIYAVPEPTAGAALISSLALLGRRRRQRHPTLPKH